MTHTYTYTQIFLAIEKLLRSSGEMYCHHLVSVVDEANKYCYKTFDGKIGVVDKEFIHDLIPQNFPYPAKLRQNVN